MPDILDVAYAVMVEPMLNGSHTSIDEMLDALGEAMAGQAGDREHWGESAAAQRGMAQAEAIFGAAATIDPPPTVSAE